jgi:hypothetical protein
MARHPLGFVWLVLLASSLTFAGRVDATDRFVATSGADQGNDCSMSSAPCASVAGAVAQAGDGDTIKIAAGIYFDRLVIDSSITLAFEGGWDASFSSRAPEVRPTVLDGSLSVSDGSMNGGIATIRAETGESIVVSFDGIGFERSNGWWGGAVLADAVDGGFVQLDIVGCRFLRNSGSNANAVYGRGYNGAYLVVNVDRSVFRQNLDRGAAAIVGALRVDTQPGSGLVPEAVATVSVTRTSFEKNVGQSGGAVLFESHSPSSTLSVDSCRFLKNRARSGGAVEIDSSAGGAFLNSVFVGNKAWQGGAIHGGGIAMLYSTVFKNKAINPGGTLGQGGGLFLQSPGASIGASIVWGNVATSGGDAFVSLFGSGAVGIGDSDVGNIVTAPGGTPWADMGGNVNVKPLVFGGGPKAGHLRPGSPVVDRVDCSSSSPPPDIDGDPRPVGPRCDMGADELVP